MQNQGVKYFRDSSKNIFYRLEETEISKVECSEDYESIKCSPTEQEAKEWYARRREPISVKLTLISKSTSFNSNIMTEIGIRDFYLNITYLDQIISHKIIEYSTFSPVNNRYECYRHIFGKIFYAFDVETTELFELNLCSLNSIQLGLEKVLLTTTPITFRAGIPISTQEFFSNARHYHNLIYKKLLGVKNK